MPRQWNLVLVPDPMADPNIALAAQLLDELPYTLAQIMRQAHPCVVKVLDDQGAAEALCANLAELGLPSFFCDTTALQAGYPRKTASCFDVSPLGWTFGMVQGPPLTLCPENVELSLTGRLETTQTTETVTRPSQVRRVLGAKAGTRRQHEQDYRYFIHIFTNDAAEAIEVTSDHFDFSGLGPRKQYATTANFHAFADLLRHATPFAVHDDRLARHTPRPLPVEVETATSRARRAKVVQRTQREDNAALVQRIATLLYLHYRPDATP